MNVHLELRAFFSRVFAVCAVRRDPMISVSLCRDVKIRRDAGHSCFQDADVFCTVVWAGVHAPKRLWQLLMQHRQCLKLAWAFGLAAFFAGLGTD